MLPSYHPYCGREAGGAAPPYPTPNLNSNPNPSQVALRATLGGDGCWAFSVAGVSVPPFDARPVISPCALDPNLNPTLTLALILTLTPTLILTPTLTLTLTHPQP